MHALSHPHWCPPVTHLDAAIKFKLSSLPLSMSVSFQLLEIRWQADAQYASLRFEVIRDQCWFLPHLVSCSANAV